LIFILHAPNTAEPSLITLLVDAWLHYACFRATRLRHCSTDHFIDACCRLPVTSLSQPAWRHELRRFTSAEPSPVYFSPFDFLIFAVVHDAFIVCRLFDIRSRLLFASLPV